MVAVHNIWLEICASIFFGPQTLALSTCLQKSRRFCQIPPDSSGFHQILLESTRVHQSLLDTGGLKHVTNLLLFVTYTGVHWSPPE